MSCLTFGKLQSLRQPSLGLRSLSPRILTSREASHMEFQCQNLKLEFYLLKICPEARCIL